MSINSSTAFAGAPQAKHLYPLRKQQPQFGNGLHQGEEQVAEKAESSVAKKVGVAALYTAVIGAAAIFGHKLFGEVIQIKQSGHKLANSLDKMSVDMAKAPKARGKVMKGWLWFNRYVGKGFLATYAGPIAAISAANK